MFEQAIEKYSIAARESYIIGDSSVDIADLGGDEYFVCDMGSGARPFGVHVLAKQARRPATVNVFMSHVHWDHIMGFPGFWLQRVDQLRQEFAVVPVHQIFLAEPCQ